MSNIRTLRWLYGQVLNCTFYYCNTVCHIRIIAYTRSIAFTNVPHTEVNRRREEVCTSNATHKVVETMLEWDMTFFRRPLLIVPFRVLPYKFHCKFHAQGLVIPCWPSHLCHLHVGWSAIFDLPHYHPLLMGWSYIFDHATCTSLAHGLVLPLSLFSHFHPSYNYHNTLLFTPP